MRTVAGILGVLLIGVGLACGQAAIPEATPPPPPVGPGTPTAEAVLTPAATPAGQLTTEPSPTPAPTQTPDPPPIPDLVAERRFANLDFRGLTSLLQPDHGPDLLFVTEQRGRILSFPPRPDVGDFDVFLDIRQQVGTAGREEGLLGLAFHPSFAENGRFYVYYSAATPRRSVLSRFTVDPANPDAADPASEEVLLEVPQPFSNHNGGDIAFGPDGYLYVGLGDGGSGGDPQGHGQDRGTLLGAILRIDVDSPSEGRAYGIPPDNPFLDRPEARNEIWAYGLRNPWRFTFDAATGLLWVADVGQNHWEEVNIVEPGGNYGWNIMEGEDCFPPGTQCDTTGLELPIHVYPLRGADECAIIGGPVYRGAAMPQLDGVYLFGDHCSGRVWGLRYDGSEVTEHRVMAETGQSITSLGVDRLGNLYLVTFDGQVWGLTVAP